MPTYWDVRLGGRVRAGRRSGFSLTYIEPSMRQAKA